MAGTVVIIAEKPSAARNMAAALGGKTGSYNGTQYEITNLRGHLYEFVQPSEMVGADLHEKYKKWDLGNLPWNPDDFSWDRSKRGDVAAVIRDVKAAISRADQVVNACDIDESGEGDLLFWEVIDELGIKGKTFARMEFLDESAKSIQDAFVNRRAVTSMQDEGAYRKAIYRSQFDYLSQQWVRVATGLTRNAGKDVVVRQGRLKSAMVKLVGDQLKAYNDYVRAPFFASRFKDENGVMYTDPDEQRYDAKNKVPMDFSPSAVVKDSTSTKTTAPPKLLDLASLSSLLVGKGVKAAETLKVYQQMYEYTSAWPGVGSSGSAKTGVVSYPRTDDKTVTPEQFAELLPLADQIARVVGIDPQILTHRQARSTHVKPQGAHGANRPGTNVPPSLDAVEQKFGKPGRLIYETLAKNYLSILAEDYVYEQQKGHIEQYPAFVGLANVPKKPGWKAVFDADAVDADPDATGDENESSQGLGTKADPFVYEGANKRPEHPSMKWLMKQLEKRDVGTGATRTSTYSEVTNARAKYPLLVEKGRKLTLAETGDLSWRLLPNTHIGDLALTERVYADMKEIAEGRKTAEECLAVVADWVKEDIVTMTENAETMRGDLGLKKTAGGQYAERAEGTWAVAPGGPKTVKFKKSFSGHDFTDDEVVRLLAGETIEFPAVSKAGTSYTARGALGLADFTNREGKVIKYVGFQLQRAEKPTAWQGVTFTEDQIAKLLAGESLGIFGFISNKTGNKYGCEVSWDDTEKKIVPNFDCTPFSIAGRQLSDAERKRLEAGEEFQVDGLISKKGKEFSATISMDPKTKKVSFRFD